VIGERRKARILVLQALYEIDSVGHGVEETLSHTLIEETLSSENFTFVHEMVTGVVQHKSRIDQEIRKFAPAFPLDQIPIVDRNILRLAIFEILLDNKVPVKVAINEAVELAKTFGGDNTPRFVNGVLGSVSATASRKVL
jgi:N utilization substance protein B